jgi:transposase
MARAYSSDLRERVVAAVMGGATVRAAADRFGVSVASAVKWSQRYRATGSMAAKPSGGKKPYVLVGERAWLLARIAEAPDLTLRAIQAELADRGVVASYHAVWDFFAHEGVTFKKKPARRRAGPSGRGQEAGALEAPSGPA